MIHINPDHQAGAKLELPREHPARDPERDWAELIEAVTALGAAATAELAAGTDASDPRMLELARQWRALIEHFTGEGQPLPALTSSDRGP
jgi:TipAS antibiotic-recognition domain